MQSCRLWLWLFPSLGSGTVLLFALFLCNTGVLLPGVIEGLLERILEFNSTKFDGKLFHLHLSISEILRTPRPSLVASSVGPQIAVRWVVDDIVVGSHFARLLLSKNEAHAACGLVFEKSRFPQSALLPLTIPEAE